jgi:acyl dehydratase
VSPVVSDALRYFEDFSVGEVVELGTAPPLDEKEIVDFARRWDPQPFHVDPVRARESMFGGLVASGWQTGAVAMRLLVDGLLSHCHALGSPGIDHIRFLRPVRPGDVLSGTFTVLELAPSVRRPGVGKLRSLLQLRNQDGDAVISLESMTFITRRTVPPAESPDGYPAGDGGDG